MNRKRVKTSDFITRANEVHGGKYNYDKVDYINTHTKVIITCPIHGEFLKSPANHVSKKQGCPRCTNGDTNRFITKAEIIHNYKYDYSKTIYKGSLTKLHIICPIHGEFSQLANNHLSGHGCPNCANDKRSRERTITTDEFIISARNVHGDKYNYDNTQYFGKKRHVLITCPIHGDFLQKPMNHVHQKQGCPQCAPTGFNQLEPGVLYVLADDKLSPNIVKIGVTNNIKQRLNELCRRTPHPVIELATYTFTKGRDAYELEQEIHLLFQDLNADMHGFNGATEWFKYSPKILDYINKKARG